jgi:hypothetical protein
MLDQRKQVIVFNGSYRDKTKNIPSWFIDRRSYIEGSRGYLEKARNNNQIMKNYGECVAATPANVKKWHCIDHGYNVNVVKTVLSFTSIVHKCLANVADDSFSRLNEVTKLYSDKFRMSIVSRLITIINI